MRQAVISDIHGNLEALDAVLHDIERQGIETIVCLGDVVGYGPNPVECIRRTMGMQTCLLGNHDAAVLCEPRENDFSDTVRNSVAWTRQQIAGNREEMKFLARLPKFLHQDDICFVHGSPRDPTYEYVFPMDAHDSGKIAEIFASFEWLCFAGHTHLPGVFREDGFLRASEIRDEVRIDSKKLLVNVGSVGQPRDGDHRACYTVVSSTSISFRRVTYPVDTTVAKIRSIESLDDSFGERLRDGR